MTCSSVQGEKIYRVVQSSLKFAQIPPRQAHSWGPLLMYPHTERALRATLSEQKWVQMAGSCCEELWMEWVVVCMTLAQPDWTLFTQRAPGIPSVAHHLEALVLQPGRGCSRQPCYSYQMLIHLHKGQCSAKQNYWWLVRGGKWFRWVLFWPVDWLTAYLQSALSEIILTCNADTFKVRATVSELRCFTVTNSTSTAGALSTFISSTRYLQIIFKVMNQSGSGATGCIAVYVLCMNAAVAGGKVAFHEQQRTWDSRPPGFACGNLSPVSEHLEWPQILSSVLFYTLSWHKVLEGLVIAMLCVYRVTRNEYSRNASSTYLCHYRFRLEDLKDQFSSIKCLGIDHWSNKSSRILT